MAVGIRDRSEECGVHGRAIRRVESRRSRWTPVGGATTSDREYRLRTRRRTEDEADGEEELTPNGSTHAMRNTPVDSRGYQR
jgi:hypothetical protein